MKKKYKIIVITVMSIVLLYLCLFLTDYIRYYNGIKPLICLEQAIFDYEDGYVNQCTSLGYKVINYHREAITKNEFIPFWQKIKNPVSYPNNYTIIDETEVCADALEEINRDDSYIYYLPCIKSETIFLKYNDDRKVSVKEALTSKAVTIDDLIKHGLKVYKESINEIELEENEEEINNQNDTSNVNSDINNNPSQSASNNNSSSSNNSPNNSSSSSSNNSNQSNSTEGNNNSSQSNGDKNNTNNNSNEEAPIEPTINETPMWSWAILDFAISKYGSSDSAMLACQTYGDIHAQDKDEEGKIVKTYFYNCTDIINTNNKLVGYMLTFREANTGTIINKRPYK